MITKRRRLPASAHAKRPTEQPAPRGRTPRGAPAATTAIAPRKRTARLKLPSPVRTSALTQAHEALEYEAARIGAVTTVLEQGWGGVAVCRGFGKTLSAPHDRTVGDVDKDVDGTYSIWLRQAP
jgi:hypothetical protein